MTNAEVGILGERLAAGMLMNKGYKILEKNYTCRYGEIDIIAIHKGVLRFIEVKTRLTDSCGSGCESVTASKRRHIRDCARHYLYVQGRRFENMDVEFQVVEINVNHLENLEF